MPLRVDRDPRQNTPRGIADRSVGTARRVYVAVRARIDAVQLRKKCIRKVVLREAVSRDLVDLVREQVRQRVGLGVGVEEGDDLLPLVDYVVAVLTDDGGEVGRGLVPERPFGGGDVQGCIPRVRRKGRRGRIPLLLHPRARGVLREVGDDAALERTDTVVQLVAQSRRQHPARTLGGIVAPQIETAVSRSTTTASAAHARVQTERREETVGKEAALRAGHILRLLRRADIDLLEVSVKLRLVELARDIDGRSGGHGCNARRRRGAA